MAAALVLPVLLVLFGVAFPLGLLDAPDHAHLLAIVHNPLTKLVLLGVACRPYSIGRTGYGSRSSTG